MKRHLPAICLTLMALLMFGVAFALNDTNYQTPASVTSPSCQATIDSLMYSAENSGAPGNYQTIGDCRRGDQPFVGYFSPGAGVIQNIGPIHSEADLDRKANGLAPTIRNPYYSDALSFAALASGGPVCFKIGSWLIKSLQVEAAVIKANSDGHLSYRLRLSDGTLKDAVFLGVVPMSLPDGSAWSVGRLTRCSHEPALV